MKREKIIAVFDEFQNFNYVDNAAFSILQKHVDNEKDEAKGLLLVIGSINSMMRKLFDNSKQPLFGRLNGNFHLKNFSTATISEILQDHGLTTNHENLFYYSIFEGIPFYYNYISQVGGYGKDKENFLKEVVLAESSILLNEGKEILLDEFGKDYSIYFSILEAIACGATTTSRIADESGIPVSNLSRYISQLMDDYELIERKTPFDSPQNNKMGRYYLKDNFLDFWFRYIFKNKSRIEIMSVNRIATEILEDMPTYMGKKFEKYMLAHLVEINRSPEQTNTNPTNTPTPPHPNFDRIGQYWDRGETELDIVFTNDAKKEIYFGECKLAAKRFQVKSIEKKIESFLKNHGKYKGWKQFITLYTPEKENFLYKTISLNET